MSEEGQQRESDQPGSDDRKPLPVKAIVFVAAVVILFVVGIRLDLEAETKALVAWVESWGPLAPAAFIGAYVIATVTALPGSLLSVVAGALFGTVKGTIVISIGSTLGATAAFLLARYVARDSVAGWIENKPTFRKLDRLSGRHAVMVVLVTRLVPLFPFNLLNFGFGLTRVPLPVYIFWSWLGMLPGTILYVAGADAVFQAVQSGKVPWAVITVIGVVLVLLAIAGRVARRKWGDMEQELEVGVSTPDGEGK